MKVSFVVPIYKKKPEQVRNCLKSLFGQSHKDIEVICVFDGKQPDLAAVVGEFKDSRLTVTAIEHAGAPKARNAGGKLATGDVVSFWDADCYAEPEMTAMWVMTFKDNPDCDFVYSGYKWTAPDAPGYESEAFDPWILSRYNYLSSMFPIKREKMVEWDESLEGLQDWDYWRRVVENGSKGRFIPGFGWATDLPDKDSISGNSETTKKRIEIVRAKHGDTDKPVLVHGIIYKRQAVTIAKLLDADYFWNPFWRVRDYKMALMIGFHPWELREAGTLFREAKTGTVRAIYWTGMDAEAFYQAPYHEAKSLIKGVNDSIAYNFVGDKRTEDLLTEMGIKTTFLSLPRETGEPIKTIPIQFKVLAFYDNDFKPLVESVIKALPDITIDRVEENKAIQISDYSVAFQFTRNPRLTEESKKILMNGRYLLSNVQEPYAGYVDTSDITKFKEEMIVKIRELEATRELNVNAQNYYLDQTSPERFKEAILSYIRPAVPVLEVVS